MTQAVTSPDRLKYGNVYLPETYVKYLESAGARVVPVLINQTDEYYATLYQSLNGYVDAILATRVVCQYLKPNKMQMKIYALVKQPCKNQIQSSGSMDFRSRK